MFCLFVLFFVPFQYCLTDNLNKPLGESANFQIGSDFVSWQKGASAQTFFAYIVESILPKLNELAASDGEDVKLEMLKLCAEMSPHGLTDENVKAAIEPIYNLLLVRFMLDLSTCYFM